MGKKAQRKKNPIHILPTFYQTNGKCIWGISLYWNLFDIEIKNKNLMMMKQQRTNDQWKNSIMKHEITGRWLPTFNENTALEKKIINYQNYENSTVFHFRQFCTTSISVQYEYFSKKPQEPLINYISQKLTTWFRIHEKLNEKLKCPSLRII